MLADKSRCLLCRANEAAAMTQYANRGINDKIDHVDALRLASLLLLLRVERALFCGLPRSAAMLTIALANVAGLVGGLFCGIAERIHATRP
jgi:hypothetical protein